MNLIISWILRIIGTSSAKTLLINLAKELAKRTDNTIDDQAVDVISEIVGQGQEPLPNVHHK